MGVKNLDNVEVTLFYKTQSCRDLDGVQRDKIIFDRNCSVKYDDGEIVFGTIAIIGDSIPSEADGAVVSFFLEKRDARDDGTGSLQQQFHSSEV